MSTDPFDTLRTFTTESGASGKYFSLPALEKMAPGRISRLPVSIRIVLESVLRNCDGKKITEEHVRQLANWDANAPRTDEIPFVVARVLLQDFTGVPLLCDLAAMRGAAQRMGKDPKVIEPLVPVDLVCDHSVQVDHYGTRDALDLNMKIEFQRNAERYKFLNGECRDSTRSKWFHLASASCTKSISSISREACTRRMASTTRIRWSVRTRIRR